MELLKEIFLADGSAVRASWGAGRWRRFWGASRLCFKVKILVVLLISEDKCQTMP